MSTDNQTAENQTAQPSEVDQLKKQLEELRGQLQQTQEIAELRAQLSELRMQLQTKSELLPGERAVIRRERVLSDRMANIERQQMEDNQALESGAIKFSVGLHSNPTRIVGANSEPDAVDKYKKFYGIIRSDHPFDVSEMGASEEAAALV